MEKDNFLYDQDGCCKIAGKIIRTGKFTSKPEASVLCT